MLTKKKYNRLSIHEKINYRSSQSFLRSVINFSLNFGFCLANLELKKLSNNNTLSFKDKKILVVARQIQKKFEINSLYQLIK